MSSKKPIAKSFYDYQEVISYLKTKHGLNHEFIFSDYLTRTHNHVGQDALISIYKEHTNPEAYDIKPEEIQWVKLILKIFGSKDKYGQQHVNLKIWW